MMMGKIMIKEEKYPLVYACYNKDESVRKNSSSGGVFYALASYVISKHGVVFGAKFNADWEVVHGYGESLEEIRAFQGSKYVQSKMGDTFSQVKHFLEDNRLVLFSGTPCQIGGLAAYLQKKYENLILVDFVCHGVPSPLIWRNYLQENFSGKEIRSISFRDKTEGWLKFSLKLEFEKENSYQKNLREDIFLKGFLGDLYLRPSCHNCQFKEIHRKADITLSDFWGIEGKMPELFDDKGTSLILIHSKLGKELLKIVEGEFTMFSAPLEFVLDGNPALISSAVKTKKREEFFQRNQKGNFKAVILSLTKLPMKRRVKNFLRKVKHLVKKLIGRR